MDMGISKIDRRILALFGKSRRLKPPQLQAA
jgi:hypothetical protein